MKGFLWRLLYAVICVLMIFWIVPLAANAVGFPITPAFWTLARAIIVCLAVLYVIWGPPPPAPF